MYTRPRPRRIVSSNVLRVFRMAGWRYSTHRRAWVFAPLSGRVGPVLRLSERRQPINSVAIASNDLWVTTPRVVAPLPRRQPGASLNNASLRIVANPAPAPEPPVALSVELEHKLERELAAAAGVKATPSQRPRPARVEQARPVDPMNAGTRWPFLVGPSTVTTVASGPALTLVPDTGDHELDVDAAGASAPFRLPHRVNPASRGASSPAPGPSRNAARPAPPLPGEPRSG